jgi:hypothetical protein
MKGIFVTRTTLTFFDSLEGGDIDKIVVYGVNWQWDGSLRELCILFPQKNLPNFSRKQRWLAIKPNLSKAFKVIAIIPNGLLGGERD